MRKPSRSRVPRLLIDVASTGVGGNIGTAELTELPAMNRSYFATVALLPGIQFTPTNQLGNDTIVASGQASQNNNVSVDGGYNTDDAFGANFGAQVRTPLEAIQESQVVTSMYGAEHGRAGAAIVNVVTRQGTNTFRGVAFAHAAGDRLTAKDFFAKEGNLPEPEVAKREWGFVVGGPIVRNKAHFFFSLERQVDKPNRTGVFSTRPSLNFSIAEDRTSWNTLIRFDHQINANHTWAVRWLREDAPQHPIVGGRSTQETFGDETDRDQMIVGTLTSVFGNSRVNTFRVARTWEHWWQGNECFRAQGANDDWTGFEFGKEDAGNQALCPPQLNHLSFPVQAGIEAQGLWDSNYQVEDHFSWFVPNKKGTHDLKVGARFNYTELRQVSQNNRNGTFRFNTDLPFDPANPRTYPERLTIRVPGAYDATITSRTVELYAQDKWQMGARTTVNAGVRYDLEIIPMDETENPLFSPGQKYPIDRNNIAPRVGFTRQLDAAGKSLVRAGYGLFYNRTLLGAIEDAVAFPKFTSSIVAHFPNDSVDPGPEHAVSFRPTRFWSMVPSSTRSFSISGFRQERASGTRGSSSSIRRTASSRSRISSRSATYANWRLRWPSMRTTFVLPTSRCFFRATSIPWCARTRLPRAPSPGSMRLAYSANRTVSRSGSSRTAANPSTTRSTFSSKSATPTPGQRACRTPCPTHEARPRARTPETPTSF